MRVRDVIEMDDMVISVNTLPEPLNRRIRCEKVRVREENGVITLTPIDNRMAQRAAFEEFFKAISETDEPFTDEDFTELENNRFDLSRELDL